MPEMLEAVLWCAALATWLMILFAVMSAYWRKSSEWRALREKPGNGESKIGCEIRRAQRNEQSAADERTNNSERDHF
ncbi:hypothetical protein KUL72_12130 [Bradyrhizobium arachidis]|uniref:hypothetical protein n=1 Tax=Bradyrhizobium TaxID=374 RepID=UPI00188DA286|nr:MULTISPECIES: hypothetical protein [Bradyrhizobium]MDN4983944.1 hypothetical protein [Bradyrhizobium sp. WYCCWR 13022]QOZ51869.1 hypothetical protein XH90_11130 [Bradyrhizobium sp. CCBAU 53338]UVO39045.1 hypothetical protein KUL72_12130 [Bradyrhizobium arachidis]